MRQHASHSPKMRAPDNRVVRVGMDIQNRAQFTLNPNARNSRPRIFRTRPMNTRKLTTLPMGGKVVTFRRRITGPPSDPPSGRRNRGSRFPRLRFKSGSPLHYRLREKNHSHPLAFRESLAQTGLTPCLESIVSSCPPLGNLSPFLHVSSSVSSCFGSWDRLHPATHPPPYENP